MPQIPLVCPCLAPLKIPPAPVLPNSTLKLGGSKFLIGLILNKYLKSSRIRKAKLMQVTSTFFRDVYVTGSMNGYQRALEHYEHKSVQDILRDLITAEGVHKLHPKLTQAYLSMKGTKTVQTKRLRPVGAFRHAPVPSNGASHTPIVLGGGAFKQLDKV